MLGSEYPGYRDLLDADYLAYIERVNAFFPSEVAALPLAEQRARYDEMCWAFHPGRPAGVTIRDTALPGPAGDIPVRLYSCGTGLGARILFFHGGGFVFGGLDSHDDTCADLCAQSGLDIISLAYRLAPEYMHPAPFEDAMAALAWVGTDGTRPVILAGESAGGTLAATVAHAARDTGWRPHGQLLIYPLLGGEPGPSHRLQANAPLLTATEIEACRNIRTGGQPPSRDPTFEPLDDNDFTDLPRTIVVTAQCDPLSSEGEHYCKRILTADGNAVWREEPRLTHSFLRARAAVPRARAAFGRIVDDVLLLAKGC